jgi:Tfp pilus assembly protein PilF
MLSAIVPHLAPGGALVFHHPRQEIFAAVWERLSEHWPALPGLVCGSSGLLLNATLTCGETRLPDPAFTEVKRLLSGASARLGRGALDEAEVLLEQVLLWAPGMPEAVKALGHLYLQTGRYEKAVQSFYEALMENPADLEVLLMMAGMYLQAGDPEQARGYAERALVLAPENPVALQMVQTLGPVTTPAA